MPKVSVIIPVYNVERYLEKCLDSVINQTLKDIEIICINDGSTDNSLHILEEYSRKDNRVIVVNQENKGLSVTRNIGIKQAKGDFIGFIDSDDFIDLNFYEQLYNTAIRTNSDLACASIIREKRHKRKVMLNFSEEKMATEVREKCILTGVPKHNYVWNKIYKTKMLQESNIQFPEGLNYEDCIFTPKIVENAKKIVIVPNTFYHYVENKNSIVASLTDKNRSDIIKTQKFLEEFSEKYNLNFLDAKKYLYRRDYYVFGIKIMKIYKLKATTKYLLFGFLPILVCEERR